MNIVRNVYDVVIDKYLINLIAKLLLILQNKLFARHMKFAFKI